MDLSGKTAPVSASLSISHLGSFQVEEYGVVYSYKVKANDPIKSTPTLADNKVKANTPIKLGKQTLVLPIPGNSVIQIYIRPYVKYKNGGVFYGNTSAV